jgi:nucleolar protein 6
MKTCLKLFHHSTFDDGLSAPRKINVELTYVSWHFFLSNCYRDMDWRADCRAGGGGNTKERKAKIQGKNEKLNEERYRKIQEEAKAKLEKAPEGGKTIDESAIHPSRRGRVPVA